jgi:Protein of unknown function (DUF2442)
MNSLSKKLNHWFSMKVKKVEYFNDYKLKILFSDKKTKIVDIEPIINKSKGLFHPLKDIEYFKKVSLDDSQFPLSICWPNGADICPDLLYELGKDTVESSKKMTSANKKRSPGATRRKKTSVGVIKK